MHKSWGCLLAVVIWGALGATSLRADETARGAAPSFTATEYRLFGGAASGSWQNLVTPGAAGANGVLPPLGQEIGGGSGADKPSAQPERRTASEFGTQRPLDEEDEDDGRPSQMGEKVRAGLLSAVLPGAGQLYNGRKCRAYIMGGIELGIWTAYFVFDAQGDNKRDDSEEWAALYAGTSGSHEDRYWQSVGRYANSDAYNESLLREARALGETATGLVTGSDTWQWVNSDRQAGYSLLRADGNAAYDRRDFMILFAVLNRAVSVVDAVIGAGHKPGVLEAEVLGLNLEMQMLPSWRDPGARCVVSRSF